MVSGRKMLSLGGLLFVGLAIHLAIAENDTTAAAAETTGEASETTGEAAETTEKAAETTEVDSATGPEAGEKEKKQKKAKPLRKKATTLKGNPYKNVNYCEPSLCPGHTHHVACHASTDFHKRCSLDAELVKITDSLRSFILKRFNEMRRRYGKLNKFRKTVKRVLFKWNPELAYLAEFNVRQCNLNIDSCSNTYAFRQSGQIVGYIAYTKRVPTLENLIDSIMNHWLKGLSSPRSVSYRHQTEYEISSAQYLQMVLRDSRQVGCAIVQQVLSGWFSTYFTCNFDVGPTVNQMVDYVESKHNGSRDGGEAPSASGDENTTPEPVEEETTTKFVGLVEEPKPYLTKRERLQKFDRFLKVIEKARFKNRYTKIFLLTSNHEIIDHNATSEAVENDVANNNSRTLSHGFRLTARSSRTRLRSRISYKSPHWIFVD